MSDDRLFTTSYRYEVPTSNAQFLRKSLALQRSRIQVRSNSENPNFGGSSLNNEQTKTTTRLLHL